MINETTGKKITGKKVLAEICCFLLVVLFLYASISKWMDFPKFKDQMHNQPFPLWLSDFFIWSVPFVEALIAAVIVSPFIADGKHRDIALRAALALMSLFTIYTALVLFHAFKRVPCSCGGVIDKLTWKQHLIFNLFFVSVAALALRLRRKPKEQTKGANDTRQNIIVSTA